MGDANGETMSVDLGAGDDLIALRCMNRIFLVPFESCLVCKTGDGWPPGLLLLVAATVDEGEKISSSSRDGDSGADSGAASGGGRSVPGFHMSDRTSSDPQ